MSGPIVTFQGVSKSYDGTTLVVQPLDLALLQGEFLTLLGPSGSGKTTTLMMLAGFEAPTSGTITLEGRPLNDVPPHRRGIGVVFQNYALFPHMTIAENLAFPLQMRRVPRARIGPLVTEALAMVRLDGVAARRPAQLSGGQQQRVALARALIFKPKLVLMDEPLGALDKQLREHMQLEIKHLHEQLGLTVVYVTHDQSEALTMSNRVAVFHQGRVQQIAPPAEIYDAPANAFVAGFIGENNRLDGTVVTSDAAACSVRLPYGTVVQATPRGVLPPGSPATLCLRPERVDVTDGADGIPAEVLEIIYHGDHSKLRLRLAGSDSFVVKRARRLDAPEPRTGELLHVTWDSRSCLAFPHDGQHHADK